MEMVRTSTRFKLHACRRCHGSLLLQEDEFICLQCGRPDRAPVTLQALKIEDAVKAGELEDIEDGDDQAA